MTESVGISKGRYKGNRPSSKVVDERCRKSMPELCGGTVVFSEWMDGGGGGGGVVDGGGVGGIVGGVGGGIGGGGGG